MSRDSMNARLCGLVAALAVVVPGSLSWAQESEQEPIEEIIVTAQRVDENIQEVPIAVTALTDDMIEDQQVITPSDLQLNAPGITYTATNFGGSSFSIRGVGSLAIGSASITGVSAHMNEIAVPSNLNSIEFFDLERVEILRGPQGTLFGRNATGGAINFVTKKPVFDEFSSRIDYETGNYQHQRLKGHVNVPLSDKASFRLAGFKLQRDGYVENLAYGQRNDAGEMLPHIEPTLDGRNIFAMRATLALDISEDTDLWFMVTHFEEDDDRARITNQICDRNSLPTTGCTPDGVDFDAPHLGATTGGIFGGSSGAMPLGPSGAGESLFDYPRPRYNDMRQIHTDFQPVFKEKETIYAFSVNHDLGDLDLGVIGATRRSDYLSRHDYVMDVGARLNPTPLNPSGIWPVSAPANNIAGFWDNFGCSLDRGTAGSFGGCSLEGYGALDRVFSFDQSASDNAYQILEAKLRSNYDGGFNFLLGASAFDVTRTTEYYVLANTLDLVTTVGAPLFGLPPLYPGFFLNATAPDGLQREGTALFGEGYFDLADDMKMTIGLRFNNDEVARRDSSTLFNAINQAAVVLAVQQAILAQTRAAVAALGIPPEAVTLEAAILGAAQLGLIDPNYLTNINAYSGAFWSRTMNIILGPFGGAPEEDLALFYGVSPSELAAALVTPAYSPERVAISKQVPIVPQFNESRLLTGSPEDASFSELSGRIGIDYQADDGTLWYGFVSKGYKPGGLNPAIPRQFQDTSSFTFTPESVIAFEFGRKYRNANNSLTLNTAAFMYDYTGLQTTVIKNNSSITENIDARIAGIELEGNYRFESMPQLGVDFSYGFLNTSIEGSASIDTTNRVGGQEDWVLLNNIDPGALTAVNYIARESQLTPELVNTALAAGAALDVRNGVTTVSVSYPENSQGVSIPAYFSRNFLSAFGVETSDGNPTDLDGNTLPYSPDHTVKIGGSYTWPEVFNGDVTVRWDYYWQSKAFSRVYNTVGDQMASWGQHNLSAIYESSDDRYNVKLWIRNLADKDNVTGHYLTSDTSGFFRNYFLTEPRIMGLSVGVNL
ncbi:MAG: TonB-dependent receptor plug domain-containing protein [Gammaproteobacteria bacterium]|nr:TonB-dependent receptor plug domain-containing protein [Gammaproteobacteria bacterium]